MMKKRACVAKYNENINWSGKLKDFGVEVIIYDKSDSSLKNFDDKVIVNNNLIKLKNIGRESHTYLKHIIDNYNSLYDVEIFLQGDPGDHVSLDIVYNKISNIDEDFEYIDLSELKKYSCFSEKKLEEVRNLHPGYLHIYLIDDINQNIKNGIGEFLGDKDLFEMTFGNNYDPDMVFELNAFAMFAVSKKLILRHPKELYQKFLDLHNPEISSEHQVSASPYKMEHFWKMLFTYKKN